MQEKYLQQIEKRANVQFRIMEAKSDYSFIANEIYALGLYPVEYQRAINELTDCYYEILKNLFVEEIILNKELS
ncbi:MAG: hypothetical protein EOO90_22990 [Pedobacter sp.]|nr:MAG: hypothetical protein EOO90_22990 [Pedobacter sp.]